MAELAQKSISFFFFFFFLICFSPQEQFNITILQVFRSLECCLSDVCVIF